MSAPTTTTPTNRQADDDGGGAPAAATDAFAPPPPATTTLASLHALYAGYDDAFDEDEDNAFGDAFTAVLARVPQLMGAVVAWAEEAEAGAGGSSGNGADGLRAAAAEALVALSAHPLLPDDVLGGQRWLDLCAALPVCLLSGAGDDEEEGGQQQQQQQQGVAAAAAGLLRFLSPAILAGSGGCADALATVLIPLLNYMARSGPCRCFSVRRHAEAAAQAAAAAEAQQQAAVAQPSPPLCTTTTPAEEAADALALQFALVGLHRLGRQWHLLDPGLGPGLAAAVCALLAAPLSPSPSRMSAGKEQDSGEQPPHAPAATAAEALLAWEPEAAWWHRLCAVTSASIDLAAAAAAGAGGAGAGEGEREGGGPAAPPALLPLLRALLRKWPSPPSPSPSPPATSSGSKLSLDAIALHALAGVLGAPALRRAALEEEERERRRGEGGGDEGAAAGAPPPPPSPLLEVLLQLAADPPPTTMATVSAHERGMADAARAAARAVVARLAGPEVPTPSPPAEWRRRAAAAVAAAAV